MRKLILGVLGVIAAVGQVGAQEALLRLDGEVTLSGSVNIYGQEVVLAEGWLVNQSDAGLGAVQVLAEVYDSDANLIGEGLGYLVNTCGTALPDYVLQPGQAYRFSVPLELYDTEIDLADIRAVVLPQAEETSVNDAARPPVDAALQTVTEQEVVAVEWLDEATLRYGVGCPGRVFTTYTWYLYDVVLGKSFAEEHPKADLITGALLRQTGLDASSFAFEHSFLSFAPDARRIFYQTELNVMVTAEPDGSFKRVLYEDLYNRSLQGLHWLGQGNFVAYYFGAYGEPVYYLTASLEGRPISRPLLANTPSVTVPGATPDGLRVIIGGTFDGKTGYFLRSTVYDSNAFLFEAELPGNNYPAPLFVRRVDGGATIYVVNPVDGEARLQCFDVQTSTLNDLGPVPLRLGPGERAWMWLSPGAQRVALAANGVNGGLWLVPVDETCR